MNRWQGDKTLAASQTAERAQRAASRNQRAARETIQNLNLLLSDSEEDNFQDAEVSFNNTLNLDGETEENRAKK